MDINNMWLRLGSADFRTDHIEPELFHSKGCKIVASSLMRQNHSHIIKISVTETISQYQPNILHI